MKIRRLLLITKGCAPARMWVAAQQEEAPVSGPSHACGPCPLREGGEWEQGAANALSEMSLDQREAMRGWGCHVDDRPCAGMERLITEAAR